MLKVVFILLLLVILVFLLIIGYPDYCRLKELQGELTLVENELQCLEAANTALGKEIKKLEHDPSGFEKIAREMGLVRPGEIIYHIVSAEE